MTFDEINTFWVRVSEYATIIVPATGSVVGFTIDDFNFISAVLKEIISLLLLFSAVIAAFILIRKRILECRKLKLENRNLELENEELENEELEINNHNTHKHENNN